MEVLNNIWSFLTTPDLTIAKIITFPLIFIENYISFCLFTGIMKVPFSKKKRLIYIISVASISLFSNIFIIEPFNLFVNYIFIFYLIKKLFGFNLVKIILAIVIPFVTFGLVNSLLLNPFLRIFNLTYETGLNTPIYRFSYLLFLYGSIYLVYIFLSSSRFSKYFNININLHKKTVKTVLINLFLGILILIIQSFMTVEYFSSVPIFFTLFNFLLLFAYFFYNFYSLIKATKLDLTTKELENSESYNNTLTILYDNVRAFKHDFDNMVNIIGGYIQVDDMEGLKEYFSSFERDCKDVSTVQMLNPNIINNPGIYNLIVSKYKKATDLDVIINFEFFFDFANLKMPVYEFSRILGILLDNAIEAAKECDEKKLNLCFRESHKEHTQIISIENTYLNKDIDTSKIYEKGFSGKENHTGIGLWEVNKIIKRFNNITLKTSKDKNLFKQELQIYY